MQTHHQRLMLLVAVRLVGACQWEIAALSLCMLARPLGQLMDLVSSSSSTNDDNDGSGTGVLLWSSSPNSSSSSTLLVLGSLMLLVGRLAFRLYADTSPALPKTIIAAPAPIARGGRGGLEEEKVEEEVDLESRLSVLLGRVDKLQVQVANSSCWDPL
ncbi:hypothetical protein BASA81_003264 [Batrachochytrium salamandrivorans]|nr:hypothetical protein BASA81_003264 [Batrachochytrium salamandrivorans]